MAINKQMLFKITHLSAVTSRSPFQVKGLLDHYTDHGLSGMSLDNALSGRSSDSFVSDVAPRRLGHDFSRMPVFPVTRATGQTERTASQPREKKRKEALTSRLPDDQVHPAAALQLQTVTTPPQEVLENRAGEEEMTETPAVPASEEIEDTGEGVASSEESLPSEAMSPDEEEESLIQTKSDGCSAAPSQAMTTSQVFSTLESGSAMDAGVRNGMEHFLGEDLSGVSIHTDRNAQTLASTLGAQAFTVGPKVAFAAGRYQPQTTEGRKLLAHELTHVVQQRRGLSDDLLQAGIGRAGDKYEVEADQVADRIAHFWAMRPPAAPSVRASIPPSQRVQSFISQSAIQLFSGSDAAAYAKKWAKSTNPTYGRFDNDCTNFASQAMLEGGWSMVGGSFWDRKDDDVWWFGRSKVAKASYTWGGAENFHQFVRVSGRGTLVKHVMNLNVGDVLQMDFTGSGHIGHTMVVTGKTANNLFLSYHTSDHLDEPFYSDGTNPGILSRNPDPPTKYYGWNIV